MFVLAQFARVGSGVTRLADDQRGQGLIPGGARGDFAQILVRRVFSPISHLIFPATQILTMVQIPRKTESSLRPMT